MTLLMFVRFRRGVVGEALRSVHLVPAPEGGLAVQDVGDLVALCGQKFLPDQAELLPVAGGAPCLECMIKSPGQRHDVARASRFRELIT